MPYIRKRRVNSMLQNYLSIEASMPYDSSRRIQTDASQMECAAPEESSNKSNRSISVEFSMLEEEPIKRLPELKYKDHQINPSNKDIRNSN